MAILVDFSPVVMGSLYVQMDHLSMNGEIQPDLVKHMIFNSLRSIIRKHSRKYGAPIICFDTFTNWRKEEFQYYKGNRKKAQEKKTHVDWDAFYKVINEAKEDIKRELPYQSIEIPRAEADDIIGTLARFIFETNPKEPVLVYSSDGDFAQLQRYPNVDRYTPLGDKFVKSKNPLAELKEKVIRGDSGDGVPNIRADDDTLMVEGKRMPPITKKFLEEVIPTPENLMHTKMPAKDHEKYLRNQRLIDLTYTPVDIQREIISAYKNKEIKGSLVGLQTFFAKNGMRELTSKVDEFRNLKF